MPGQADELASRQMRTLHEIVTLTVPRYPDLDAKARTALERDVTRYVAMQITSMPSFLRLPYRLALLGFALIPLLRYGRRFDNLPRERRGSYLAAWNDAPLAPMRDFVKLIRNTALLAYFDHPVVRERLDAERQRATSEQALEVANE